MLVLTAATLAHPAAAIEVMQMIDAHQSCTLADRDAMLRRDGAAILLRGLLAVARSILRAMHESRRRQAEDVLRRHAHLVRSADARHATTQGRARCAGADER